MKKFCLNLNLLKILWYKEKTNSDIYFNYYFSFEVFYSSFLIKSIYNSNIFNSNLLNSVGSSSAAKYFKG